MAEIMVRFDDLRRYCEKRHCGSVPLEYIKQMRTVEAAPVRRGRWLLLPNSTAPSKLFRCSECGNVTEHKHFSQNGYYSFCKDCGADMRGGVDNANP